MKMRAVFLDRDGVLNKSNGRPPNTPEELDLLPRVAEAISKLKEADFLIFVVTNQGGVGLGYMTKKALDEIHNRLILEVESGGGVIDEIKACIHKPRAGCMCRKPKPGMIFELAKKYNVDLSKSYMIGDREPDIDAGEAANLKTIFIGTKLDAPKNADHVERDLWEATQWILEQSYDETKLSEHLNYLEE
ncbi:MAG: HAD family hydrolase [Firmicutes bacterium]|nr:HAD family hydrolase [Bacillota bacterium]MDD4264288.1 HAD family hydrolase [Bacillota bacterium]